MYESKVILADRELEDLKIKCPYCEYESSLSSWFFWTEIISRVKDGILIPVLVMEDIYSEARCPVCKTRFSIEEEVGVVEVKRLKQVVESMQVDLTNKLIQCPSCKIWNDFYDWSFKGFAGGKLSVELAGEDSVRVVGNVEVVNITKVICERCGFEVEFDKPVIVHVPVEGCELKLLLQKLRDVLKEEKK